MMTPAVWVLVVVAVANLAVGGALLAEADEKDGPIARRMKAAGVGCLALAILLASLIFVVA